MLSLVPAYFSSFRVVLLTWPLVAGILALPILIWQYRRHGGLRWSRALVLYLIVFYLLGLALFTPLPLPDDFARYCAERNRPVRVVPFGIISELLDPGYWDVVQVVLNFLFFVPLGILASTMLRLSGKRAILLGLGVSLLIEVTQLTALWGLAPCRYRVADIDDVILNVAGVWLGVQIAKVFTRAKTLPDEITPPEQ